MNFFESLLTHSPALIVAVPLLGAFLTPLISKINDKIRNAFVVFIVGLTGVLISMLSYDVLMNNKMHNYVFGGDSALIMPASGESFAVRIIFAVDGLNAFMIIIVAILAFVGVIYSWHFMKEHTGLDKYYTLVLLMIAGMLGMMLTGDMFNFFVFLEITSISSCALIAFYTNKGKSVLAGFKYIVISTIGALFILFAIALLYGQYNALNMAVLANSIQFNTFTDKIALVLLISGLGMKAGIVPMHMWLPDSYGQAPSSVTLILIGTTQAGLYALFRMVFTVFGRHITSPIELTIAGNNILAGTNLNSIVGIILVVLAILTMIIGVMMALKESDFKRMIAFAAVAEIGYMVLAIGAAFFTLSPSEITIEGVQVTFYSFSQAGQMAIKGGLFHIINDALDIGLLFLVAGAIYYVTKETSLNKLGGLARNMKFTTIFFIIGLLAVSGMPPMNGFASKLLIYESIYLINPILAIVAILCSILLLATFVKVLHSVFLGPKIPKFDEVKEVPASMLIGMGLIAIVIIFFGLFPNLILENIVQPAADALMNYSAYIGGSLL